MAKEALVPATDRERELVRQTKSSIGGWIVAVLALCAVLAFVI